MVHAECLQEINIKEAQLRGVIARALLDISIEKHGLSLLI